MGQYSDKGPVTPAEEINYYLNNPAAADEEAEQAAAEKARLDKIADENTKSHSDALTIIIIAFVMIFFGTVFTALTNQQDFSEKEGFTFAKLVSGEYFAEVEEKFNTSLPLQDQFHNVSSSIKYCFGLGNELDLIDIESKRLEDDPYSISNDNEYVPVYESSEGGDENDEKEVTQKTLPEIVTTSNNKNKKITGIKMTTLIPEDEMLKEDSEPQTVDRNAPQGYHDPDFSPYSEAQQTQPAETQPTSEQTEPAATSSSQYIIDPNGRTVSETQPPQPDVTSGEPGESTPQESEQPATSSQAPPATTSNNFLVPAIR